MIKEPRILGEELLIITSEYQNFEQTHDRLDVLVLDTTGQRVVIELKRDRADDTTDLQAIKYASYCATLTAEDNQRDYRQFWNAHREEDWYRRSAVENLYSDEKDHLGINLN